jgi:hypothetical protein
MHGALGNETHLVRVTETWLAAQRNTEAVHAHPRPARRAPHTCREPNETSESGSNSSSAPDGSTLARLRQTLVVAAPPVATEGLTLGADGTAAAAPPPIPTDTRTLRHNPTVDQLYSGGDTGAAARRDALRNHTAGHVEDCGLPSAVFEQQYNSFHAHGHAQAPDGRVFGGVANPAGALVVPDAPRCCGGTPPQQQIAWL